VKFRTALIMACQYGRRKSAYHVLIWSVFGGVISLFYRLGVENSKPVAPGIVSTPSDTVPAHRGIWLFLS
jgi:hypothetical protein